MHDTAARTTDATIQNEQLSRSAHTMNEKFTLLQRRVEVRSTPMKRQLRLFVRGFAPPQVIGSSAHSLQRQRSRFHPNASAQSPVCTRKPTTRVLHEILRERARQACERGRTEAGRAERPAAALGLASGCKSFERGPTCTLPEIAASRLFPPPLPGAVRE